TDEHVGTSVAREIGRETAPESAARRGIIDSLVAELHTERSPAFVKSRYMINEGRPARPVFSDTVCPAADASTLRLTRVVTPSRDRDRERRPFKSP
ncbi:hypothetical protein, partial [Halorubrum sp. Ea1]|uniref:hypothetical protein n=1 Tax=Halorubrum sp. Ea1 TaxID=1480718 RepID=UPI001C3C37C0